MPVGQRFCGTFYLPMCLNNFVTGPNFSWLSFDCVWLITWMRIDHARRWTLGYQSLRTFVAVVQHGQVQYPTPRGFNLMADRRPDCWQNFTGKQIIYKVCIFLLYFKIKFIFVNTENKQSCLNKLCANSHCGQLSDPYGVGHEAEGSDRAGRLIKKCNLSLHVRHNSFKSKSACPALQTHKWLQTIQPHMFSKQILQPVVLWVF